MDATQKQDSLKNSGAIGEEFSTVPAEEISEKQRMAFLVWKTLEMKFRLRKIQESLQEHHGTIKLAPFQEEFEYSFNAEDQKDREVGTRKI